MPCHGHPRYAHAGAGMLTVAAEAGAGDFPDAVTDGDGGADLRRASNRPTWTVGGFRVITSCDAQIRTLCAGVALTCMRRVKTGRGRD